MIILQETRAYELLTLIAVFGELPVSLLPRISEGKTYKSTVVTEMKRKALIKLTCANGLRGLRLTKRAKEIMLADNPHRFSFYLNGNTDTNHVRCDPHRRERLHRIAEATVTMKNAGAYVFRDQHPAIFSPSWNGGEQICYPLFYLSREMREYGADFFKTKGARYIGVLLTEENIFVTYNFGNDLVKWGYAAEIRSKALIETVLCLERFPEQYSSQSIKGIVLGNSMELAYMVLTNETKQYFILDDNYENFYFVTNDEKGEMLIRLLCRPDLCTELDEILTTDLSPAYHGSLIENDAFTEDGRPVLLAYKCDLVRIRRFCVALSMYQSQGVIICFDYQADVLRRYFDSNVEFQTLDFNKTKRRFFGG